MAGESTAANPAANSVGALAVLAGLIIGVAVLLLGLVRYAIRQQRDLYTLQTHYRNLVDLALGYLAFRIRIRQRTFVPELASPSIATLFGHPLDHYIRDPKRFLTQLTSSSRRALLLMVESTLRRGQPLRMELVLRHADGSQRRFLIHARPSVDGSDILVDGICLDLTAILHAEEDRRVLQHQLELAHRHESLGLLAGGVAHDFNNILGAIRGNAELLRPLTTERPHMTKRLDRVLMAVDRATGLVRQILAYAGSGAIDDRQLDLGEEIRQIAGLLKHSLPENIHVELALAKDIPRVRMDPIHLQQVIINLIVNAADSYEGRPGAVTVGLLSDGRHDVTVMVSDLGIGMDATTRERMWDPYFTTKANGHGLGLAAVRGIVDRVKGRLDCRSSPGKGTTIAITFPASHELPSATATAAARTATRNSGIILVVDDDGLMRETVEAMLRDMGLTPISAGGGREALRILAKRDPIDAVVLDCRMPDLDGPATLELLRQHHPDLPVLLVSGYERDHIIRKALAGPSTRFLGKPFTSAQLRTALHLLRCIGADEESSSSSIPTARDPD